MFRLGAREKLDLKHMPTLKQVRVLTYGELDDTIRDILSEAIRDLGISPNSEKSKPNSATR